MVAGLGRTVAATSHHAGIGRVRERALLLGQQVIAIDNIGTLEIVRGRRSWLLFVLGLLIVAGSATQINSIYQTIAAGGLGLGLLLVVVNLMQRIERGLAIGACDGRGALIVSRDEIFLQRLLTLLADKINTHDPALLATFDIGTGRVTVESASVQPTRAHPAIAPDTTGFDASPATSPAGGDGSGVVASGVVSPPDDGAATLFGDGDAVPPVSASASVTPQEAPVSVAPASLFGAPRIQAASPPVASRRIAPDPLLDGSGRVAAVDDDWLSRPRPERQLATSHDSEGGAGRVMLALLLITVLGAIVFAAWYFTGQTGSPGSISLIASSEDPPAPEIRGVSEMETVVPQAPPVPETAPPAEETEAAPPVIGIAPFSPPETLVARASGLAYRSRPALDGEVLAETRAGGEALSINARMSQADGDWYRVALLDGREAWFKASQAVERARLAETVRPRSEEAGLPFAASSPRILEPAEGVQIGGGPQTVLLAWSSPSEAVRHVVEIESYDALAQRWISDPQHRRVTVEGANELAEAFDSAGYWRWRVRSVSAAGEQSQFSRWAAFGIRN